MQARNAYDIAVCACKSHTLGDFECKRTKSTVVKAYILTMPRGNPSLAHIPWPAVLQLRAEIAGVDHKHNVTLLHYLTE
jgi:hypothetical protein